MNVMFRYCFDLYYFREIMTSHPLKIARRFSSRRGVNYHVAQAGFRDYIDARCDSRDIPVKLRELSLAIQTIPVTSADAERGFSSMNLICSPERNRLTVQRTSNCLFVSLVGPPVADFSPRPYVKKWLVNHRAASDNQSKKIAKTDTDETRYSHMVPIFR